MQDQEAKLRQEIMQDAERKAKRLTKNATRDAKKLLASIREEQDTRRADRLAEAEQDVEQRVRAVLATTGMEIRRRRLADVEVELRDVLGEAVTRARALPNAQRRQSLLALLADAAGMLGPTELRLACSASDRASFCDADIRGTLKQVWGGETDDVAFAVVESDSVNGGLIAESADGRRRVDNSFDGRLERMMDELRTETYRIMVDAGEEGGADR